MITQTRAKIVFDYADMMSVESKTTPTPAEIVVDYMGTTMTMRTLSDKL